MPETLDTDDLAPLAQRIRIDIISGAFTPGQRLRFTELRDRYAAGASQLREVMAGLAAEQLVVQEQNRGFRMPEVSLAEIEDLIALRRKLEPGAVAASVAAGDEAWEEELLLAHRRLKRLGREEDVASSTAAASAVQTWEQRHRAYHVQLFAACPSSWTQHFCQLLTDQFGRYRRLMRPPRDAQAELGAQHDRMLELALDRQAGACAEVVDAHIALTGSTVLRQMHGIVDHLGEDPG